VVSGLEPLVVVDSAQHCIGVLTDRNIAAAWHLHPGRLDVQVVADVLPGTARQSRPSTPVTEAAHLMLGSHVDALPVMLATAPR